MSRSEFSQAGFLLRSLSGGVPDTPNIARVRGVGGSAAEEQGLELQRNHDGVLCCPVHQFICAASHNLLRKSID